MTASGPSLARAIRRMGVGLFAAALASCGGSGEGGHTQTRLVTVSGEVTGLVGASRATLRLSDGTQARTDGAGRFTMSAALSPGSSFTVSFQDGDPPGYRCAAIGGTFSADLSPVNLSLSCTPREWVWAAGTDASLRGTYTGLGLGGAPGARDYPSTWVGADGSLWLFGGMGFTDDYGIGYRHDLWRFSPSTEQWTWVDGSAGNDQAGVFVAIGSAGSPGSRSGAATWTDDVGRLWLFGGNGYDGSAASGALNDLWRFDPATQQWTWMAGSAGIAASGTYPTLGGAGSPGARANSVTWKDAAGNLWLFGGYGYDEASMTRGSLNDLWRFDTTNLTWIWEGGSKSSGSAGVYEGAAASLYPGARSLATAWQPTRSEVWLFGGFGLGESSGSSGKMNDLWRLDLTTRQWTWWSGSRSVGSPGTYVQTGDTGQPGARWGAAGWTDAQGGLWLFGGRGVSATTADGDRNDLWHFSRQADAWTWVRGDESLDTPADATAVGAVGDPGGRRGSGTWIDGQGQLWIFGGGRGAFINRLASLWRY